MTSQQLSVLKERYERVTDRIQAACDRSGRATDEVTLVAVSKTYPAESIQALYDLGHRDFGENNAQELSHKYEVLSRSGQCPGIRWHLIGHLQRNKVKMVVDMPWLFHALDSRRLTAEIGKRASATVSEWDCLLQVNISDEESKFGVEFDSAPDAMRTFREFEGVRIRGLMAMARPDAPEDELRSDFKRMRLLRDSLDFDNGAGMLSIGMSQDFEVAIEEGATHVRIGSAIFGNRS